MTEIGNAYDQGKRDARIDNHDVQLLDMSADVKIILNRIDKIANDVQALALNAKASEEATKALAAALKAERDTARDTLAADRVKSDTAWSPYSRLMAVAVAVSGMLGTFYVLTH